MSFLDRYPVDWSSQPLQELHGALSTSFYRSRDIEEIVAAAGVPPGDVALDGAARNVWFSAIHVAAGHRRLAALVDAAGARLPALQDRIAELLAAQPVLSAPMPADRPESLAPDDPRWKGFGTDANERQIVEGDETMLDVAFLERGVARARGVCRLTVSMDGGVYYGTAFRIGDSLLLTNHHVLHDWEHDDARALAVVAAFDYQVDMAGRLGKATEVDADVETIVGDRAHDFAVISTREPVRSETPILPLKSSASVAIDDRVLIVQHPNGLPKKIALAHNLVRHVDGDVIQYWTDTEPGSSGSPVFNEAWDIVALHHCWVPSPHGDGTAFRNQGRTIGRVLERLRTLGVEGIGA